MLRDASHGPTKRNGIGYFTSKCFVVRAMGEPRAATSASLKARLTVFRILVKSNGHKVLRGENATALESVAAVHFKAHVDDNNLEGAHQTCSVHRADDAAASGKQLIGYQHLCEACGVLLATF